MVDAQPHATVLLNGVSEVGTPNPVAKMRGRRKKEATLGSGNWLSNELKKKNP